MAKVIPLIRKPEPDWLWFAHKCANTLYQLRGDGKIVCSKCGEVIGDWNLDDDK